ncbi:DUF4253 domain-containing protein [Streptomyces aquilus]|uniref:DUF4253 domain-containing protein n=1 Tax=Streptomyces aquilus TaxID=2548456 RepID=A0A3Q9C191_9ACTN|nr:DUF4253 domain-containing protein [Streptomyces aquilus]AZP19536.1 DUF4253 domain-containing protein [Streptomyces aquilus]
MASLPNPLPALAGLELGLPSGTLLGTTLWLADAPAHPGDWTTYQQAPRTVGLLPVLIDVGAGHGGPGEWELAPGEMSYPGDHDAEEILSDFWEECCAGEAGDWPGLAAPTAAQADADAVAADVVDSLLRGGGPLKDPCLALVPTRRSADIPTAIGWTGPTNYADDTALLSAVLRSWEDRFGARVVALGFDQLIVSVAAPPTTLDEALAVAAEHFAFCPDNIWQGPTGTTLQTYAERQLLNRPAWHFWWD